MKTLLLLCLAASGCAITPKVVTTEITKNADGTWVIKSPKDVDASYYQLGQFTSIRYKSRSSDEAIKSAAAESASRAAAVAKLAEAAASLK